MQAMDRDALIGYVREQRDGVVASLAADGAPQAAYLELTATDRGELVFNARSMSRKIANIRRDPRVTVVVGGPDRTTLQCEGLADLPQGDDRERCAAAYVGAFPHFAGSLSTNGISLIRVRLTWARFGDFRLGTPQIVDVDLDS